MDRLLSVRIDVPRDRGDVFPGDVFERRAIDDLNISWTSLLLTERFAKGSRGDRPLNRTDRGRRLGLNHFRLQLFQVSQPSIQHRREILFAYDRSHSKLGAFKRQPRHRRTHPNW
jgi:hypothetical protein